VLEFAGDECGGADPNAPETIFVHFDDAHMLYPHWRPGELYLIVPREALDWYRSLTAEQVKELETRREREIAEYLAWVERPRSAGRRK